MKSILYYTLMLVIVLIYLIPFTLLFLITYPFDKERVVLHAASRFWCKLFYTANPFWKVELEGVENIDPKKAYVIVTNHQSMLDIPIMYFIMLNFKWVSKKEVMSWPIFGWVLMMHGDIKIDRGSKNSIKVLLKAGCERLKAGTSVIIFPEGTRSKDGQIGRFKEGAFMLAKKAEAAILPCHIEGTGTVHNGWKLRMPHKFKITVMPAVEKQEVADSDIKQLRDKVRELYND